MLVVDDNASYPISQRVARGMLEKPPSRSVATTCVEAPDAFEQGLYNIILMDLQMPEMDGLEASIRIRKRERPKGGHVLSLL